MKTLLHILAVLSLGFFLPTNETADIYIKKGSQISITGNSNVNCFTCHYSQTIAEGCQQIKYEYENDSYNLKNAELNLESKAFDCGGRMINKDFNKLMESEHHPHIKISFDKIKIIENDFQVTAEIEIADKINSYDFMISSENTTNYLGTLELNIEDFGMEAPHKLFGAIKVEPDIIINFDLNLQIE